MRPTPQTLAALLAELLRRAHLGSPSELPGIVADEAERAGLADVAVLLVDYEQQTLIPAHPPGAETLAIAGTVGGRAFSSTAILRTPEGDGERLWMPLIDGTERIGLLAVSLPEPVSDAMLTACERVAHLVALLIVTKSAYGDAFELTRRTRPMTLAAELAWGLAPPQVFATADLVLAGMLEPCYDNGGDAFDYALDGRRLYAAVLDGMGHGLAAAGVAAFALTAYRHSRRCGKGLSDTYDAMDAAVGQQFPDNRFVTAIIAELDLDNGDLRWISAGHPPPLVIRDGRVARTLQAAPSTPLGLDLGDRPAVATERLEPGDLLLLYTDGLTEARGLDGQRFGEEGLAAFIEREAAAGLSAPETLRRLRHAVVEAAAGSLRDDASALLLEWRRGRELAVLPDSAA